MTVFMKERPPEKRFSLLQIHGDCLEKLGIRNCGGGYAIIDKNIRPQVGDLVFCGRGGSNIGGYIKQVKQINGNSVIVGTAYLDESRDFQFEASEIYGVVLETYDRMWGLREYVRPTHPQETPGRERLYAVRDEDTGKLVSDLTNPRRKYWDRRGNAVSAICNFNSRRAKPKHGNLKLVVFELVEVQE